LFVTIIYVCLYVRKISRDPSRSIIKDDPFPSQLEHNEEISAFTTKHKIIASVFLVFIGIFVFCVFKYDWSTVELAGIFMMMAITVALIDKMPPNTLVTEFMKGVRKLAYGALIIGIARSIVIILEDGNILDTIVHAAV